MAAAVAVGVSSSLVGLTALGTRADVSKRAEVLGSVSCSSRSVGTLKSACRGEQQQQLKNFNGLRAGSVFKEYDSLTEAVYEDGEVVQETFSLVVYAGRNGKKIQGRKLRVAVVGGGPAGGCAAETLAEGGIETFLLERKLDNAKPCGGAIPLCMVSEFNLPMDIIDRKVTKIKYASKDRPTMKTRPLLRTRGC